MTSTAEVSLPGSLLPSGAELAAMIAALVGTEAGPPASGVVPASTKISRVAPTSSASAAAAATGDTGAGSTGQCR